jgi:predicted Zn finger-like uncharacterized protein
MSLITRCPACRTMFKVVPDQLRISDGWVRCGKCEEIFDASAYLQEEASVAPAAAAAQAAEDPVPVEAVGDAVPGPIPGGVDFELQDVHDDAPALIEPIRPSAPAPLASSDSAGRDAAPAVAAGGAQGSPAASLSFMRQARKSSRWHRPLVRATLGLLSLALALGLALQLLVQERDRIAAREPGLKPLIEEACHWLDCQVRPLREIDAVVIDSSAFTKVRGDMYRLSVTLKNREPVELAMPAIELSLTDALDVPLARRVLQPAELGVPSGVIPAASETQSALVLSVKLNGNGERVAGYRLLAFYP